MFILSLNVKTAGLNSIAAADVMQITIFMLVTFIMLISFHAKFRKNVLNVQ